MFFNQLSALWSALWRQCKKKAYIYAVSLWTSALQQQNLARADWQCCEGKWLPESCSKKSIALLQTTALQPLTRKMQITTCCCCCSFLIKEDVAFCMHKYMSKEELRRGMQNCQSHQRRLILKMLTSPLYSQNKQALLLCFKANIFYLISCNKQAC